MSTKTELLDSAERLARSRGYDGFSYADLSSDVGIRKASIHYHFPSKADLALELARRYRGSFVETLEGIAGRHRGGGQRLAAYLDTYHEALNGGQSVCLCVAFSAGRDSLSDAVLAEVDLFETVSRTWLAETFRRGQEDGTIAAVEDPQAESMACLALVEGAQLLARSARDVARFDAATASLRQRIR